MEWHERLNTEIKIGDIYKNRDNELFEVVDFIPMEWSETESYKVRSVRPRNEFYLYKDYTKTPEYFEYFVTKNGGFGSYPNHRDLIEIIKTCK